MSQKRGLGKGLDALIPTGMEFDATTGGVLQIPVDDILPNPRQTRINFNPEELSELAASIQEHGILQPLIVSRDEEGEKYTLIAGDRRLQASRIAGLATVPVIVRRVTDQQRLEWTLIENLQRSDLNPLESAEGYRQLAEEFGLSHMEIANRVGKSRTAVTNTLRLLKLSPAVRQALREGKISEGHARSLLALPSAAAQSAALQTILQKDLTVRQTEELVRRLTGERSPVKSKPARSPEEIDLEERLRQALGTRVILKRGRKGGSIVIRFYSDEELNALVERILAENQET
jgi:ParB family chromosome partitioning protein